MSMHLRINRKPYREPSLRQHVGLARTIGILTAFGILLLFSSYAYAQLFHIYFEKDGKPYDKPVTGEIRFYFYAGGDRHEDWPCHIDCPGFNLCMIVQETLGFYTTACELAGVAWVGDVTSIHTVYFEGETEGQEFVASCPFDYSSDCFTESVWLPPEPSIDYYKTQPRTFRHCELTFDILTTSEATDSDGNGETTDSDRDGGNDGGCFIATLLQP